jgi:predicted nucleic acid-binding Zn ribbon protein
MYTSSCRCRSDKTSPGGGESNEGPLGGVVKDLLAGLKKRGRVTEEEMAKVWRASVGRKAAGHSKPVSLKKASLVVNVDRSSWLYELTLGKKEILKKLEGKFKGKRVREIRFRIGAV